MARKKKNNTDEVAELDKLYEDLTGLPIQKKKQKGKAVFACIALALVLIVGIAAYIACFGSLFDSWLPMRAVSIAGVELQGLTKSEAKALVAEKAGVYQTTPMVIRVLDTTVELTPEQTGAILDADGAVNAAFRSLDPTRIDLTPYLNLDAQVIREAVDALGTQYNSSLSHSVCSVTGEAPSLAIDSQEEGTMKLTVTLGSPEYALDADALYAQVLENYSQAVFTTIGSCSVIEPEMPNLDSLYEQHAIAPVDAVMDMKTFDITPETNGYGFDLENAKAALATAEYGQTLEFPFIKLQAAVTKESLGAILYRDVLGTCKTEYDGSDNNSRNTNLRLACEAINGYILYPGETFSYNQTLGERTAERGYKPAPAYIGGQTVSTYGGGICQVSSTLYYCTLLADLQITERWHHSYISSYMEPGMDATVSWGTSDFRFTNNTNYPIRIEAYRADGYVNVQLLGTDEKDYYVKMEHKTLGSTRYETVYQEMAADNKEGYKDGQVIVTPYTGYKVQTYKCKYSKQTGELISRTEETLNNYLKRDKIICKIIPEEQQK